MESGIDQIFITKPLLPDKQAFLEVFDEVYDSAWLTNMGAQHNALEAELSQFLKVSNLSLFNNGTIAALIALRALNLPEGSEVITTPFTFAATPHSIIWNGLKIVFADIDPNTMTLCPDRVKKAITPRTSAILGVHVYGLPCDVQSLAEIAKEYCLKLIYDGAHAFTTEIQNIPITHYGDITMLSFHATKLFNSIEGGALVCQSDELCRKVVELRNFGIKPISNEDGLRAGIANSDYIQEVGINGKLNELQAAWGRLVLKEVQSEQTRRHQLAAIYSNLIAELPFLSVPQWPAGVSNSMQYFPVLCQAPQIREELYACFLAKGVYTRKYFYPLCSDFTCYSKLPSAQKSNLPLAHDIANRVLCLPFYGELATDRIQLNRIMMELRNFKGSQV